MRTTRPGVGTVATHTCMMHDSIDDVDAEAWADICGADDLAMDRRLLAIQQRTLSDQCRMWFAVVRDDSGRARCAACLCLFKVDAVMTAHPLLRRWTHAGRAVHHNLLRFGVLFCGLPFPAGSSHLRLAREADARACLHCLHAKMHNLAGAHSARLLVFKEFEKGETTVSDALHRMGYRSGDIPAMYALDGRYACFDDFVGTMRSRYRAQVMRSRRKIADNGFVLERHEGASRIADAFTASLYRLYDAVWNRSQHRLERLPRAFFLEAARALNEDATLTVIRRASGRAVGFTFSVRRGRTWHNLYSGVDYSINGEGDLLFNLFYADLDAAFERGCDRILLGQTAEAFKARIGGRALPLQFFARARSSLAHAGLRVVAPAVFPRLVEPGSHSVFRESSHLHTSIRDR